MFVDARALSSGEKLHADICIVGAGAAGITLALELAGNGRRVILAESGGLEADEKGEDLNGGESIGLAYKVQDTRSRFFGGTTNLWGGACRPLDAMDFAPREWIAHSGWPFGLSELLAYYKQARPYCELPADEDKLLPFPWSAPWEGAIWEGSPTKFGERYRSALENAPGVTVLLNANLLGLEVSPGGAIAEARFGSLAGNRHTAVARRYVLACGGLENARLLLIFSREAGAGVLNAHDLVGRFFMEHPALRIGYLVHDHPATKEAIYFERGGHSFRLTDTGQRAERIGSVGAYPHGVLKIGDVPLVSEELGLERQGFMKRLAGAATGAVRTSVPEGPISAVHMIFEQSPDPDSRVTLGRLYDGFGQPRLQLDWRLNALDRKTCSTAVGFLLKQADNLGSGQFWMRPALRGIDFGSPGKIPLDKPRASDFPPRPHHPPTELCPANHHMGTTRMNADPRKGVTDAHGLVHGTHNLYVAGSSVFPTSGISNPTLTIVALALRLAQHLKNGV